MAPRQIQHIGRRAPPVQRGSVGTADNPHGIPRHPRIKHPDAHRQVCRVISRIHINRVPAPQRVGGNHLMQSPLRRIGTDPQICLRPHCRAIDIVRQAVIVHIKLERRAGGRPHTEQPCVRGRHGKIGRRHPPQNRRVGKCRRPGIDLIRRRHRRDIAPSRPVVGAVLQYHLLPVKMQARHPFQPGVLNQVPPIIKRHRKQPRVGITLARLRRPPIQPHVQTSAIRHRLVGIAGGLGRSRHQQRNAHHSQPTHTLFHSHVTSPKMDASQSRLTTKFFALRFTP